MPRIRLKEKKREKREKPSKLVQCQRFLFSSFLYGVEGWGCILGLGLVGVRFRIRVRVSLGVTPLDPKIVSEGKFLMAHGFLLCPFSCPLVVSYSQRRAYKKELGYLGGRNNVALRSIIIHPLLLEPLKYLNVVVSILPITFSSY